MSETICFTWGDADIIWENNPYTWNEVCLILGLVTGTFGGGPGGSLKKKYDELSDEEKEEFITLVLKVKGKTIKDTKKIKEYKVTANDVKLTVETVLKSIKIEIKK